MRSVFPKFVFPAVTFLCPLLFWNACSRAEDGQQRGLDFFERRIRPVLAAKCWKCHGRKKQESGLRLDSRAEVLKGSDSGKVVVPGHPEKSRLLQILRHSGEIKMPPGEKLPQTTIAAFATWVKLGLPWPDSGTGRTQRDPNSAVLKSHWAFQPIRRPTIPATKNADWAKTPIDQFILAKLESAGLSPSSRTDKRTLLRRVTYDLTGLPPTPEDLADFETDDSPDAFAKIIDRLLASPQYGERWGRHWLDVARYADNKGYVFFEEKTFPWAYTYRDYVVRSLNEDKPYDRFVLEQLAADRLDLGEDKRPLTALGFLTLGGRFMNNVHDVIDDRIDVVTRGLMGVTVTCARCHDHKFDPVSQADYYSLYSIFRSSTEPTLQPQFQRPPSTEQYTKFQMELQKRLQELNNFVKAKRHALITDGRTRIAEYLMAAYAKRNQPPTDNFMLLVPAGDLNPTMIDRWQTWLADARRRGDPVWRIWHWYAEIPDGRFAENRAHVQQRLQTADLTKTPVNSLVLAAFRDRPPETMKAVAARYAALLASVKTEWENRLKKAGSQRPHRMTDDAKEQLRQVLFGRYSPPDVPRLLGYGFLSLLPDRKAQDEFKKLIKAVEQWSMKGPGAPPRAMVLLEGSAVYQPRIFRRGNPARLGEAVSRRLPQVVDRRETPLGNKSGRLTLAKSIVDSRNPLTSRVIVNRIWQQHFDRGLVNTPSDFGTRSTPPSHPALLDWLATELMEHGWSLKHIHRLIFNSAVYQQSSARKTRKTKAIDPENRLFWRMNRRRLDFEAMRDSLLAVSGSLDQSIGGPPVNLKQVGFTTRRTIYGFVDRMNLPNLFRAFDFPSPASTSPKRETTTISPQALFLMNHGFVMEASRRLAARRDIAGKATTADRLRRLYTVLFQREPTVEEQQIGNEFLGERPAPDDWGRLAHALLMTNEFLFID